MPSASHHPCPLRRPRPRRRRRDTFDFLNTLDHDDGFPREKLPDLRRRRSPGSSIAASSTSKAPIRLRREARLATARRGARISSGSTPSARPCARSPTRSSSTGRPTKDALDDGQSGAARPPGHRARAGARRRQRRPPPRRRPDRRRPGAPRRPARPRADRRSSGAHPDLRQRHLPLDLLRHLADRPPALVRHGDLRQPREGRAPPREDVAQDLRRASRRARGPAGPRSRGGSSTPRRTATGSPAMRWR